MSKIRVNEISNNLDDGPVYFPYGVSGDASRMILKPGVVSFTPSQLATNVGLSTSIQVGFNQTMQFSGVGTIYIREGSATGTIFEQFECGVSAGASITNNLLTITPSSDLTVNTTYFVTLPSTGIANTFGATIEEFSNYQFQTIPSDFTAEGGDFVFTAFDGSSPTGYYKYHVFANPGILTTTSPSPGADNLSMMMIGGGGAGGIGRPYPGVIYGATGGGGAGGYLTFTGPTLNIPADTYTVTIGAGGSHYNGGTQIPYGKGGMSGEDTILTNGTITYTAEGGGCGGSLEGQPTITPTLPVDQPYRKGFPGGSGGGGGWTGPTSSVPDWLPGGFGVPGQGNSGARATNNRFYPNDTVAQTPPGTDEFAAAGGGGGGAGSSGSEAISYGQGPALNNANIREGQGGNGSSNPAFPGVLLAPRISTPDPQTFNRLGPTNNYWAGGGAGGATTGPQDILSNRGGYGGGGSSASPTWRVAAPPTDVPGTPSLPDPGFPQNGAPLTGGGGAGGHRFSDPLGEAGDGGPGCMMLRYATPGS